MNGKLFLVIGTHPRGLAGCIALCVMLKRLGFASEMRELENRGGDWAFFKDELTRLRLDAAARGTSAVVYTSCRREVRTLENVPFSSSLANIPDFVFCATERSKGTVTLTTLKDRFDTFPVEMVLSTSWMEMENHEASSQSQDDQAACPRPGKFAQKLEELAAKAVRT